MDSKLLDNLKVTIKRFNYFNDKELFLFTENPNSNEVNDVKSIADFKNGDSKFQHYKNSILTIVCSKCSDDIIRFVNSNYSENIVILLVPSKFQFDIFVKKIVSSHIDTIVWNVGIDHYIIIVNNQQFP